MCSHDFFQRHLCLEVLKQHLYFMRQIIARGEVRYDGRGPRYLHEVFMEVCLILLFVGDVCGYIAVNDDGVVDPVRSYAPFLERLVQCMEIMHTWCIRHPSKGQTPKHGKWLTTGTYRKVLKSAAPVLRVQMAKAVYPHVTVDTLMPDGVVTLPAHELRQLFLEISQSAFDLTDSGTHEVCGPLHSLHDVKSIGIYLSSRTVLKPALGSRSGRSRVLRPKEEVCLSLRLVSGFDALQESVDGKLELYWKMRACGPHGSVYDGLNSLLRKQGVLVSF